jgi:hypothetical protein
MYASTSTLAPYVIFRVSLLTLPVGNDGQKKLIIEKNQEILQVSSVLFSIYQSLSPVNYLYPGFVIHINPLSILNFVYYSFFVQP